MPDKTPEFYEFEGVRLYVGKSEIIRLSDNAKFSIRPKERDFLKVLLDRPRETVAYEDLQQTVWPDVADAQSAMRTMRETKRTLDRLLRDVIKTSSHLIMTVVNEGYCIRAVVVANYHEATGVIPERDGENNPAVTTEVRRQVGIEWHIWMSCVLYSLLFSIALPLEIAYQWDRHSRVALALTLPVFGWIMITSILGLKLDERLTKSGKAGGLAASILCFFLAATVLVAGVSFFLPSVPVTESTFQTYPAQAAYLKDAASFLVLASLFLLLPFHFIADFRRALEIGDRKEFLSLSSSGRLSFVPKGTLYPRFWALCSLLVLFALVALAGTTHLLDNLRPGPYMNLFVALTYVRWILYFGLGLFCLAQYHLSLNNVRYQCLVHSWVDQKSNR